MTRLVALLLALLPSIAAAHDSPTGWKYPWECCSNRDCKPVDPANLKETSAGYLLTTTGEVVPYTDRRVKDSPDGLYHICQQAGDFDNGQVLCLFRPPMSF